MLYQPALLGVLFVRTRSSAVIESKVGNRVTGGAGSGIFGVEVVDDSVGFVE